MQPARRLYRRESEESRRTALILATQELVAEGGPEAATVRAIAERAGVTPGLIRHYFQSKDELSRAAYRALMDGMTAKGADAIEGVGAGPEERLAAFIAAPVRDEAGQVVGVYAAQVPNLVLPAADSGLGPLGTTVIGSDNLPR